MRKDVFSIDTSILSPNIILFQRFMKVITFFVELSFSPNAKCYKICHTILMIIFPSNFCLSEADPVKERCVQ